MAGGFNMMELMSKATQGEAAKPKYEMRNLPIERLKPNPSNLYSMEGIDELADSILLAGRVLQNIVVQAADSEGRYMILSGHRRHEACKKLVEAGHTEFATIPALIENEADENLRELMLIYTNSTSRSLTDAEKMLQARRAREILTNLKAEGKFEGRIRDAVSRMLNTTGAQIARYAAIDKNLTNTELKQAFEDGRLCRNHRHQGHEHCDMTGRGGKKCPCHDMGGKRKMEKKGTELKPCPFCGSREVKINKCTMRVMCKRCYATSGFITRFLRNGNTDEQAAITSAIINHG